MQCFCLFKGYALFLLQKMKTLVTQNVPSQPTQPEKMTLAC